MPSLSVILPSFNEEENIPKTAAVLSELLDREQIDYELLFVDDGSRDNTWAEIRRAHEADERVHGIRFSRNFGKEAAISAGLAAVRGECAAVMDCDLQHPPEALVEMYRLWQQGYEVVEGVKKSRGNESAFHHSAASIFYKVMSAAIGFDMSRASDFKLLDRKAINTLLEMPEYRPFFRAVSSWIGYKSIQFEFDVQDRMAGESKWSTRSLIRYAIDNIAGFTAAPMQIVTWAGVAVLVFSIVLGIQTLIRYFTHHAVEGFSTVIILILFIGSIVMISLGIIGYYVARIFEEVKRRPKYIVSGQI